MKAQDLPLNNRGLRLGNKVLIDGKVCTVDHLYGQYIRTKEMPSIIDAYRDAYGIELTPEVLEACGFEFVEHFWSNSKGSAIHYDLNNNSVRLAFVGPIFPIVASNVKYLHQLQNLYYSLTGEELTVNIPQPINQQ